MSRAGRVLLLDVMGTLVHDPFYVEVPAHFGMTLQRLIELKSPTAWVDFELDRIGEAALWRRFFADGRAFDGRAMRDAIRGAYRFVDGVEPLLRRLRASGVPMHALSNYPRWYELIEAELALSRYVSWSFVSCEIGVRKPDAGAYLEPARRLGMPPSALVFVDDNQSNCDAAQRLGLHAILFETADQLASDLESIGMLSPSTPG